MTGSHDAWEHLARRGTPRGARRVVDAVEAALGQRRLGRSSLGTPMIRLAAVAAAVAVVAAAMLLATGDDDTVGVAGVGTTETTVTSVSSSTTSTTATDDPVAVSTPVVSPTSSVSTTPAGSAPTTTTTTGPDSQPPAARVATAGGSSQEMEQGSYCWRESPGGGGTCADTIGPGDQTPVFDVGSDAVVEFRWITQAAPEEVTVTLRRVGGDPGQPIERQLAATNPTSMSVDVAPGTYDVILFALWDRGDTSHFVRLRVTA